MTLSIIIVNYNVKYFLEQCLYSVYKSTLKSIEVIVVDNNSTDGSIAYLQDRFPTVLFLKNISNNGFSKACNQGFAVAKGSYILFLNPDTIIAEDTLSTCLSFFEKTPNGCAIGVRMIDGSGEFLKESKRSFPGPLTSLFKLTGLAHLFPQSKLFARYHLGHLNPAQNHEVDVLAGAFMMIPEKVLKRVGAFDEEFFMYGEDVDLSYRIQKAGFKNYYVAQTTIIHFKGESTKRGSLNYVRLFYSAMSLFVKKHFGGAKSGVFTLFIHVAIWLRAIVSAGALLSKRALLRRQKKRALPVTLIVGSKCEVEEAHLLLQKPGGTTSLRFFYINKTEAQKDPLMCAGEICNEAKNAQQIVLCTGTLSYKTVFHLVEMFDKSVSVLFHAAGSGSIVASSFSGSSGEVFSGNTQATK